MLYEDESRMDLKNSSGVNALNVRVVYDKRVTTEGEKLPLVEKPYLRHRMVWQPLNGAVLQLIDDTGVKLHVGTFGTMTLNMGHYKGSWNPNLNLSLYAQLHDGEWFRFDGGVPPVLLNPDLLSQTEVKALNKLRDKSGQADLDLGLFWAERRETAKLFKDAALGILRLAQKIANKDIKGTVDVLKEVFSVSTSVAAERRRLARLQRKMNRQITHAGLSRAGATALASMSDAWLGYNLGLSPLARDVDEAYRLLQTGDLTSKLTCTAKARYGKGPHTFDDLITIENYAGKVTRRIYGVVEDDYQVILKAIPKHDDQANLARMGLANPAALAYNATSLTFVLDYWLALGPFLNSLSVPLEFEFVDGSWSHRVSINTQMVVTSSPGGKAVSAGKIRFFERKVYSTFPVPIPPLSLRNRDLTDRQFVTTGLLALNKVKGLFT